MSSPTIATVIERLDLLDGVHNDYYTDHDLKTMNSTGACQLVEERTRELPSLGFPVSTSATVINPQGERVPVDCEVLVQRFNTLINIAQKLPSYRFMADLAAGIPVGQLEAPSREDLYGFHIVDHMIISLLIGTATTDMSFEELFGLIPYKLYTDAVESLAGIIPTMAAGHLDVENGEEAYDLFEGLGRKYGFDASPFRPANHQ